MGVSGLFFGEKIFTCVNLTLLHPLSILRTYLLNKGEIYESDQQGLCLVRGKHRQVRFRGLHHTEQCGRYAINNPNRTWLGHGGKLGMEKRFRTIVLT